MEELISIYLFKNKKCPLPEIGTLQLAESCAVAWYADKRIEAPHSTVKLVDAVTQPEDFIRFISENKHIEKDEALNLLRQYCRQLYNMDAFGETSLPNLGKFYLNNDGNLVFKAIDLPKVFQPQVKAERVIHPVASHDMMVGDRLTTTTEMAAFYSETETASDNKWWIWAAVLFMLGSGAFAWYVSTEGFTGTFGNTGKFPIQSPAVTYRLAE